MSYGAGVHPTGAVALNLFADDDADDGETGKIKLGSLLGKRRKALGRAGGQPDPATGRYPQLVTGAPGSEEDTVTPFVATALSSAPKAAGRGPRRSPFAAQVAGLATCRKALVVSDILPGEVAFVKRHKHAQTAEHEFKLYQPGRNAGRSTGWTTTDKQAQQFGLCVSGASAGCAIDVVLGGIGSAFVTGHTCFAKLIK